MRVTMASLLVVAILAPSAWASNFFSSHELAKVEEYAHRIASEKLFLRERAMMLMMERDALLAAVDGAVSDTIGNLTQKQMAQDGQLNSIKDKLKVLAHLTSEFEGELAEQMALVNTQATENKPQWDSIYLVFDNNLVQNSTIAKIGTSLHETEAKLNEKLADGTNRRDDAIDELLANTKSVITLANTRHCVQQVVEVHIDPKTAVGEASAPLDPAIFEGNVPTVFCAAQGFRTKLDTSKDDERTYGYHDDRHNLAVSLNCKPFSDNVEVQAFDQSRGKANAVKSVYVQVKTCSFAAQSSGTP